MEELEIPGVRGAVEKRGPVLLKSCEEGGRRRNLNKGREEGSAREVEGWEDRERGRLRE